MESWIPWAIVDGEGVLQGLMTWSSAAGLDHSPCRWSAEHFGCRHMEPLRQAFQAEGLIKIRRGAQSRGYLGWRMSLCLLFNSNLFNICGRLSLKVWVRRLKILGGNIHAITWTELKYCCVFALYLLSLPWKHGKQSPLIAGVIKLLSEILHGSDENIFLTLMQFGTSN